jgi:NAD(P)-dependent dehydrogenase (short-subunit alcohol dehydrogenase family)
MTLLTNRTAVIYGAAGSIGSAVAHAYAREGARVFVTGRTLEPLTQLAHAIRDAGGVADAAVVDATNQSAVEAHAATVIESHGAIDIAFNATSNDDLQGIPLVDLRYEDFTRPIDKVTTTHFLIATAVARHMMARQSGVILAMGGGREAVPQLGGSHVAWAALAGLCRQLACELGPRGIRVAWILSPGSPEPSPSSQATDDLASVTMLNRRPSLEDVAHVATFLASEWADTITAAEINITGGAVVD